MFSGEKEIIYFNHFRRAYQLLKTEIDESVNRVLQSGWYILGKEDELFEKNFASYLGVNFCCGVANGTEAIALALTANGIGEGDEVITTNISAFATVTGIMQAGAKPVVADIMMETGLIDYREIEKHITPKTKAIIPVHLYGQCCDMENILGLAAHYNLVTIEDCAQSTGASYRGKKCGSFGKAAAFSFYPTKNLGAFGDGGLVATDDETVYNKLLSLRNYGQTKRYYHEYQGINSRLDELQAAILNTKLSHLDQQNQKREEIAVYYRKNLKHIECLEIVPDSFSSNHLFVIKTNERDSMMNFLAENKIQTLIHYPVPVNQQKAFGYQKDEFFRKSEQFSNSILSIPLYPELTDNEIDRIVDTINSYHG